VRVLIHPKSISADTELRSRVAEALEAGLGSVLAWLRWVDVYLTDVNGPRGGADKRCRVVAHTGAGPVVVERIGRDPVVAALSAANRCRRLILARQKRRRDRQRRVAV
jgi:hypothetical protein